MGPDLYEVLEVPDNASDIWIKRAYELKRKALDEDASLTPDQRERRSVAIDKAFNVLSNPLSRERYDNRDIAKPSTPVLAKANSNSVKLWAGNLFIAMLMAIGALYWYDSSNADRLRAQAERLAAEQKVRTQQMFWDEAMAANEKKRPVRSPLSEADTEASLLRRERDIIELQRHVEESRAKYEEAAARRAAQIAMQAQAAETQRQNAEMRRIQIEEEIRRRQAQADLERQAAWVRSQRR